MPLCADVMVRRGLVSIGARRTDADVAVVGAGVVGLRRRAGPRSARSRGVLLEAERAPGLPASGTNSGILHTGFDSPPGELETRLILRAAELRDARARRPRVPVVRCGALMRPAPARSVRGRERAGERRRGRARPTARSRSRASPSRDPVAYTLALAGGGRAARRRAVRRIPRAAIERSGEGLWVIAEAGDRMSCRTVVNCAGLRADEVARMAGDDSFEIYPRKGEFLVFESSRSTGSCFRCRRSERRACSSSRPSTATSPRGRPPSTARTRTTGRCGPRRATRSCRRRPAHVAAARARGRGRSRPMPACGRRAAGSTT